jgi:hypothetical protein
MRALSSLNLANNKIGQLVPPAGWSSAKQFNIAGVDGFKSPSGKWQAEAPQGSKPEGAIALANAIKDMGALQCTDVTPYQSKKSFMVSTHVCRHCGQHKTQHTSR